MTTNPLMPGRAAELRDRRTDVMVATMGVEVSAERAKRELLATGETVRKRTVETRDELTAQEAHIARLARDGLSNPAIVARLFTERSHAAIGAGPPGE